MTVDQYIDTISKRYKQGNTTEHTFRGDLQQLIESIIPDIRATNEPKRQACGAPDYILTKQEIPIGYIEAKDIGDNDLSGDKKNGNKEQFDRYKASLNNIIFTDYLSFHVYRDGQFLTKVSIGTIENGKIKPIPEAFQNFTSILKEFCIHIGQTINSSKKLAELMAGKARLLADVIEKSLHSDETNQEDSTIKEQMQAFKEILIHDITPKAFADVYAQTITYGMFAARLHDPTLDTFSRQEAAELIPKSNPFLRKLFGYIAGPDIDDRIRWIVDGLAEIFLASNVRELLKDYGKSTQTEEPIIHFYETFLSEYDPSLRKSRGVWYTPLPVVNFIVRAIDDILKIEFGLPQGLADTSKTKIKVDAQGKKVEQEVHKVQVLDPATGTGTFLAQVVKYIYKKFERQKGVWNSYAENHLLPRIHGFELLMASYAMAHLQLDLLLSETGFTPTKNQRLKVYLTNSLEEHHPDTGTLFASWLSQEANEANYIKRDTPVMVVLGNPPYSGESANKGEWIMDLMESYKKEPGGVEKLKERNPKWINDDYVKFLRYGQHLIEKNGSGILAFINPHGFLDNPTFRGMRWNLLNTYDTIYTIDLHGNAKKKETAPDGSKDENVFDIMQGVSINIFVKTGKKKKSELGKVYHYDLYGTREDKYKFLLNNSIQIIPYKLIPNKPNMYYMVQKNFGVEEEYKKGFSLQDMFLIHGVGITTAHDDFVIHENYEKLLKRFQEFQQTERNTEVLHKKFYVNKKEGWNILQGYDNIKNQKELSKYIQSISYRPFDNKYIFYEDKLVWRTVRKIMQHFIKGDNVGLVFRRQQPESMDLYLFCSKNIIADGFIRSDNKGGENIAPLYLYETDDTLGSNVVTQASSSKTERTEELDRDGRVTTFNRVPNLNMDIVNKFASILGIPFSVDQASRLNAQENDTNKQDACSTTESIDQDGIVTTFTPLDILDYIYAILHSPSYREKYKEFLKIDFPRVPYPDQVAQASRLNAQENDSNKQDACSTTFKELFFKLVNLGSQLRQLHLLESPKVEEYITEYPVDGSNRVEYIVNRTSSSNTQKNDSNKQEACSTMVTMRIYINETQYFDNVPAVAWNFYIGGYQPAQKWLKDRKDRKLEFEDILHYQKIIVALTETDRLMKEVDSMGIEW